MFTKKLTTATRRASTAFALLLICSSLCVSATGSAAASAATSATRMASRAAKLNETRAKSLTEIASLHRRAERHGITPLLRSAMLRESLGVIRLNRAVVGLNRAALSQECELTNADLAGLIRLNTKVRRLDTRTVQYTRHAGMPHGKAVHVRIVRLRTALEKQSRRLGRKKGKPSPAPTVTPTATPSPTAQPSVSTSEGLILSPRESETVRQRIASGMEPFASAWVYFRDGRVASALSATPNVDVGPTAAFSYTKLDTDSRRARDLAVAYACTGTGTYAQRARQFVVAWAQANNPAPYSYTQDFQGGYHQSYGAFSFALAYDLTKDSGVYTSSDVTMVKAWFRTWCTVMKGYQDHYAEDYWFTHTGRRAYEWPNSKLTYDQTDFYTGRDTAAAPAAAWLACAIVSEDNASIATLFNSGYTLNVPSILHSSCAPDNDGDGNGTGAVPQVLIMAAGYYDNASRGGCLDYMTYNARLAAMLYQMSASIGRSTAVMRNELHNSWVYLSRFSGSSYVGSPAPNDVIHWDLHLSRIQSAVHVFGDQQFVDDTTAGQYPQSQFYESQFLGPTTLTQPQV